MRIIFIFILEVVMPHIAVLLVIICVKLNFLDAFSSIRPITSRKFGVMMMSNEDDSEAKKPKLIQPITPIEPIAPIVKKENIVKEDVTTEKVGEEAIDALMGEETEEEKYKREKLAEIAEAKAKEVFVTQETGRFECQACGYVYDVQQGMVKKGIAPGTAFENIEKFRCPQCGASKKYFVAETETLSGFKENLKYGLGTNAMTGEQKGLLINGGLLLGFAIFMSGYLLE